MDYVFRFVRLTHAVKVADRFLISQTKTSSDHPLMGRLFCLVEITQKWFPSAQIGQLIINALTREYFTSPSSSDLENFEHALRRVNEILIQVTKEGQTDWIGNLHSILALGVNDQLHLSCAGNSQAILFRDKQAISLLERDKNDPQRPVKTFSEIISGSLKPYDKVLVVSSAFMDYFSRENLKKILLEKSPYQAGREIARIIKHEKTKPVELVILELLPIDVWQNQKTEPEVIYLDQPSWERLWQFGKGIWRFSQKSTAGFNQLLKTKASPYFKKYSQKFKELASRCLRKIGETCRFLISKIVKKEKVVGKTLYTVRDYTQTPTKKIHPLFDILKNQLRRFLAKVKLAFKWLLAPKNRSFLYVLIAIILLVVLLANIGVLRQRQVAQKRNLSSQELIQEIKNKKDEARMALIYNDKEKAKKILWEIATSAESFLEKQGSPEVKEILRSSLDDLDKLTSTKRFTDLKPVVEFSNSKEIFSTRDYLLTVSPADNKIYYSDRAGGKVNQHSSIPANAGLFKTGVVLDKTNIPFFLTDGNAMFALKNPALAPDEIKAKDSQWPEAIRIASFSDNLYFLNSEVGQIYKYSKNADGYEKKEDFVDTGTVDIKNSLSLTIDGAVYVLKQDGTVVKLIKGKPQTFSIRGIPTPQEKITKAQKIWTSADTNSLYILDGARILEFDKNGGFISQIAFGSEFKNIQDFYPESKEKKMWILSENKVYEIGL